MWMTLGHEPLPKINPTPSKTEPNVEEERKPNMVHMKRSDGTSEELELETYLIGVVGSEMSASFEVEALKAQAVAARTFVAQREFQVDDSTASQVYQDEEQLKTVWGDNYDVYHEKITKAIQETQGEVMTYQGECITAAFFSSSNGFTNSSEDYWQNALPYLRSVESPWDKAVEGNTQTAVFTLEELSSLLGFQSTINAIQAPTRFDNGYVKEVNIDGIVFTGREIREALSLRSSAFEITIEGSTVTFTTHGFGHGIGMSQYGANAMAQEGKTYKEILKHYYTAIEITQLDV